MLKLTLLIIFVIACLLWVSEPKITHPFKITFAKPWFATGIALIGFGVGLIRYQGYKDGVKSGVDGAFNFIKKEILKQDS